MSSIPVFVGLDYHQNAVQVCVVDSDGTVLGNKSCPNDGPRIVAYVERLGSVKRVAIEACTGAANLADELVERAGWSVDLAHAGYVARIKQGPDKSDFADAHLLADLERVGYLPRVWLAPEKIRTLRRMVRYRQQLMNERRNVKLRIRALLREHRLYCGLGRPWTKPWMHWLRKTGDLDENSRWIVNHYLTRLDTLVEEVAATHERLRHLTADDAVVAKLQTFCGVGEITAWMLRAEIGRFDRFGSGKQLARFCGLSPRNASSGTRQADARLVKAGNPQLRAIPIETAHRLMRFDPRWMAFTAQMLARGKKKSVIAAAVGNRWMRWLYHQMQEVTVAA